MSGRLKTRLKTGPTNGKLVSAQMRPLGYNPRSCYPACPGCLFTTRSREMSVRLRCMAAMVALVLATWSNAQQSKDAPAEPPLPPPPEGTQAAVVNGQVIPETAVYRACSKGNPKNYDAMRKEVLNYLIDNVLIDQYLVQLKIKVEAKEIDDKLAQIKTEATRKDPAGF